jgi:hypothetical protein
LYYSPYFIFSNRNKGGIGEFYFLARFVLKIANADERLSLEQKVRSLLNVKIITVNNIK